MGRSIWEPHLLVRVIRKKKQQLGEIEQDLEKLPLDHPARLRLFERRLVLEKGIPELEAEYANRTGERQLGGGDSHSKSSPVQSKLAKEETKLSRVNRNDRASKQRAKR